MTAQLVHSNVYLKFLTEPFEDSVWKESEDKIFLQGDSHVHTDDLPLALFRHAGCLQEKWNLRWRREPQEGRQDLVKP